MKTKTVYASLSEKIRACKTRADFTSVEYQYTRQYHAGTITAPQLARLDVLAMELQAKLPDSVLNTKSPKPSNP